MSAVRLARLDQHIERVKSRGNSMNETRRSHFEGRIIEKEERHMQAKQENGM